MQRMADAARGQSSGGIFVSYRRDNSRHFAGRLSDRLAERFGAGEIFMDVDSIRPGADFDEAIDAAVASCEVLLVLIGPNWVNAVGDGGRRLDDPVVLEVTAALRRRISVVPVLVDGAAVPRRVDLPPVIGDLARADSRSVFSHCPAS